MATTKPLTDAITALTTYANGVTGASDTNLSDAVRTLADGYGGGGGSSVTVVASGEFAGASSGGRQGISIGKKMASTDWYLLIKAKDASEFERNENRYDFVWLSVCALSKLGRYNLAGSGNLSFAPTLGIYDNNSGTLTTKSAGLILKNAQCIWGGNLREIVFNTFELSRNTSDGTFHIYFGHSNSLYSLPSNITYEYEIVYFGSNPSTDIVEIS
jgi:hypothetical protein